MSVGIGLDEFSRRADAGARVIPVWTVMRCDDLTPLGIYRSLCGERDLTFLLESAEAGVWSRYSFIGVDAQATLTERDGEAAWLGRPIDGVPASGDPLVALARTLEVLHTEAHADLPPLTSGMVGYLGYDVVRRIETLPDTTPDDLSVPELVMMLASDMAVVDHHTGELWLIANAVNFDDSPAGLEDAYRDAVHRVHDMVTRISLPQTPVLTSRIEG
ncbi:MAG: anthranilate synthase component I, partial [Propionibacterium sp.]|nr:anthranilate synthase component I [Propionibacterium sp.]